MNSPPSLANVPTPEIRAQNVFLSTALVGQTIVFCRLSTRAVVVSQQNGPFRRADLWSAGVKRLIERPLDQDQRSPELADRMDES